VPGLPDGITTCLFDLDGVLTETARWVVRVDRTGHAEALREHGADVVVLDLAELLQAP
jgi:phosphoglycolate phosphatase-like HAD superfamily hydrolase